LLSPVFFLYHPLQESPNENPFLPPWQIVLPAPPMLSIMSLPPGESSLQVFVLFLVSSNLLSPPFFGINEGLPRSLLFHSKPQIVPPGVLLVRSCLSRQYSHFSYFSPTSTARLLHQRVFFVAVSLFFRAVHCGFKSTLCRQCLRASKS